ncbi:MAG: PadR family transcriptional regulator [Nitrososphaerales archaeon]
MSRSAIPRGFSRLYILTLLLEKPMTGKQIIEETEKRTQGAWKPSPGLVYPLLAKLLTEGLIEEVEGGYRTTEKGKKMLEEYKQTYTEFERGFNALLKIGLFSKIIAQDLIDRIIGIISLLREDIANLGKAQREKYKAFLRAELKRLEEEEQQS